LQTNIKIRLN